MQLQCLNYPSSGPGSASDLPSQHYSGEGDVASSLGSAFAYRPRQSSISFASAESFPSNEKSSHRTGFSSFVSQHIHQLHGEAGF